MCAEAADRVAGQFDPARHGASGIDGSTLDRSFGLPAALGHARRNGRCSIDVALAGPLDKVDSVHWSASHHEGFAELLAPLLRQT